MHAFFERRTTWMRATGLLSSLLAAAAARTASRMCVSHASRASIVSVRKK
jgi:hypothetical protein